MARPRVALPDPLSPTRPSVLPRGTPRDTRSTARMIPWREPPCVRRAAKWTDRSRVSRRTPRSAFALPGKVRWTSHDGMGIQFGNLGARETHTITELVAAHENED